MELRTRFAPSPTGFLHLGHAYAALAVQQFAQQHGAAITLRIEDIDAVRCRPEFTDALLEDLRWIGFAWDEQLVQSQRLDLYAAALKRLEDMGLAYRCFCSRRDIAAAAVAAGPEGPLYPGTCRDIAPERAETRAAAEPFGWRFNHAKAAAYLGEEGVKSLCWQDVSGSVTQVQPGLLGDVLLAGRDRAASYHLAVVVDDARPEATERGAPDKAMTHIVRGRDLLHATHVHRLLQAVLGYPAPVYHHHSLLVTPDGRKLAKSERSLTLCSLRAQGVRAATLMRNLEKHRFPAGILCDDA